MLVAHDKDGNRIYANAKERYRECFCPECGKPLRHRMGDTNINHFAHKADEGCPYGIDKDSKSEWHIHMQELFPSESLEVRFKDKTSGEVHIADVYLESSNTVIEFQHSHITMSEFRKRTLFHTSEGRRIVWVFDEKSNDPNSKFGRFRQEKGNRYLSCYNDLHFKWMRSPRKMLTSIEVKNGNVLQNSRYSVCAFYGEENIVHRIIDADCDYSEVTFSVHSIKLAGDMDVEEFFLPEDHWLSQSSYREIVEKRNSMLEEMKRNRENSSKGYSIRKNYKRSIRFK